MDNSIEPQDLLNAVVAQRDAALNEVARLNALVARLQRRTVAENGRPSTDNSNFRGNRDEHAAKDVRGGGEPFSDPGY